MQSRISILLRIYHRDDCSQLNRSQSRLLARERYNTGYTVDEEYMVQDIQNRAEAGATLATRASEALLDLDVA